LQRKDAAAAEEEYRKIVGGKTEEETGRKTQA
jgi:hypothetical protein